MNCSQLDDICLTVNSKLWNSVALIANKLKNRCLPERAGRSRTTDWRQGQNNPPLAGEANSKIAPETWQSSCQKEDSDRSMPNNLGTDSAPSRRNELVALQKPADVPAGWNCGECSGNRPRAVSMQLCSSEAITTSISFARSSVHEYASFVSGQSGVRNVFLNFSMLRIWKLPCN